MLTETKLQNLLMQAIKKNEIRIAPAEHLYLEENFNGFLAENDLIIEASLFEDVLYRHYFNEKSSEIFTFRKALADMTAKNIVCNIGKYRKARKQNSPRKWMYKIKNFNIQA